MPNDTKQPPASSAAGAALPPSTAMPADAATADPFTAFAARVLNDEDRILFAEAVSCAAAGARRAAYVMTWISAAESIKRKFRELAQRDKKASGVLQKVAQAEAQHRAVDTTLLDEAKTYGFIADAEHAQLSHVYEMRSVYAHPYEQAPTPEALLAAGRVVVDAVLSRPTKLRHGFIADRVALVASDPHFLDDTRAAAAEYAEEMHGRVADDLHPYVLTKLWDLLQPKVPEPTAAALVRRGRRFTLAYLRAGGEPLIKRIDWGTVLPPHATLIAPVLADPLLFPHLPKLARDMVVAHVLELAGTNANYVTLLEALHDAGHLDQRHVERLGQRVDDLPLEDLAATDVSPVRYVGRVVAELKRHNWYHQNPAIAVLRNVGPERVARLPDAAQHELGNNVLQAADGLARAAGDLIRAMAAGTEVWPPAFVAGVVAECFVNDAGAVRFKTRYLEEALLALGTVPAAARAAILDTLALTIEHGGLQGPFWGQEEFEEVFATIDAVRDSEIRESPQMRRVRQVLANLLARELANNDITTTDFAE